MLQLDPAPSLRPPPTAATATRPFAGLPARLARRAGRIGWQLLRRPLRRVARERRATTAVEFALILGPLLALLLGSLQTSLIFFANEALQSAATNVGREIMTGSVQQSNVTQSAFQQLACAQLSSLFSCGGIMVDVESAGGYSSISTTPPTLTYSNNGAITNAWAFNPGGPDDVVIVRVMYNWPIYASALIPGLADQPGNRRLLIGTSVFKNEPFP